MQQLLIQNLSNNSVIQWAGDTILEISAPMVGDTITYKLKVNPYDTQFQATINEGFPNKIDGVEKDLVGLRFGYTVTSPPYRIVADTCIEVYSVYAILDNQVDHHDGNDSYVELTFSIIDRDYTESKNNTVATPRLTKDNLSTTLIGVLGTDVTRNETSAVSKAIYPTRGAMTALPNYSMDRAKYLDATQGKVILIDRQVSGNFEVIDFNKELGIRIIEITGLLPNNTFKAVSANPGNNTRLQIWVLTTTGINFYETPPVLGSGVLTATFSISNVPAISFAATAITNPLYFTIVPEMEITQNASDMGLFTIYDTDLTGSGEVTAIHTLTANLNGTAGTFTFLASDLTIAPNVGLAGMQIYRVGNTVGVKSYLYRANDSVNDVNSALVPVGTFAPAASLPQKDSIRQLPVTTYVSEAGFRIMGLHAQPTVSYWGAYKQSSVLHAAIGKLTATTHPYISIIDSNYSSGIGDVQIGRVDYSGSANKTIHRRTSSLPYPQNTVKFDDPLLTISDVERLDGRSSQASFRTVQYGYSDLISKLGDIKFPSDLHVDSRDPIIRTQLISIFGTGVGGVTWSSADPALQISVRFWFGILLKALLDLGGASVLGYTTVLDTDIGNRRFTTTQAAPDGICVINFKEGESVLGAIETLLELYPHMFLSLQSGRLVIESKTLEELPSAPFSFDVNGSNLTDYNYAPEIVTGDTDLVTVKCSNYETDQVAANLHSTLVDDSFWESVGYSFRESNTPAGNCLDLKDVAWSGSHAALGAVGTGVLGTRVMNMQKDAYNKHTARPWGALLQVQVVKIDTLTAEEVADVTERSRHIISFTQLNVNHTVNFASLGVSVNINAVSNFENYIDWSLGADHREQVIECTVTPTVAATQKQFVVYVTLFPSGNCHQTGDLSFSSGILGSVERKELTLNGGIRPSQDASHTLLDLSAQLLAFYQTDKEYTRLSILNTVTPFTYNSINTDDIGVTVFRDGSQVTTGYWLGYFNYNPRNDTELLCWRYI